MNKRTAAALLITGSHCWGVHLAAAADGAFGQYAAELEARLGLQHSDARTHLATLSVDGSPKGGVERQLMLGDIRVEPVNGTPKQLPGALLHHWRGAAFVPDATPAQMLALLRDYSQLPANYAPEVLSSRVLSEDGEKALLAVRLREQKVWTVVLDAEYRVEARLVNPDRGYSSSRSAHIWQVEDAGTSRERRHSEGDDDGYLWRLNSYWSFARARGGLLIECEAVSLTRDIPAGLGWLVAPVIQNFPSQALQFTLRATQNALSAKAAGKVQK